MRRYRQYLLGAVLVVAVAGQSLAANDLSDGTTVREPTGDSAFGNYLAGLYARAVGDTEAAAAFYADAVSRDSSAELSRGAFRALLAAGRVDEAVSQAISLDEEARSDGLAPIALVVDAVRRGDFDAASQQLENIPLSGMNVLLVPVAKAWVQVGQGDSEAAIAALDPLRRSEQARAFRLFHEALIRDLTEQTEQAEAAYRDLVDNRASRSLRAVQAYALFLARNERAEDAAAIAAEHLSPDQSSVLVEDALASLQEQPPRPLVVSAAQGIAESLYGAVRFMFQNGDRESAAIYGHLALHLSPKMDVVRLLLGNLMESAGQWDAAIETYRAVEPETPLGWNARQRIAASLRRQGNLEEAMTLLRAMAEERTDRTDVLVDLGDMLRSEQRWREAADAYTQAIERAGEPSPGIWGYFYSRGIAFERSDRWPEAESDFLKALELQPEQPQVLNYLGYSWVEQGLNLDRAKKMLERAVDLRPRDGYIIDSLGWVLFRLGDYDGAVVHLERATALRPTDPVINDHLGDAYWRVGRKREARYQWERALIFEPEEDTIPIIRRKLREGLEDI